MDHTGINDAVTVNTETGMKEIRGFVMVALLLGVQLSLTAQNLLQRRLTMEVNGQRLDHVLEILSNKGDFYFSYSSGIVARDSLVSLKVNNRPVKEILQLLFNQSYEFRESGNYVIIRKAPIRMTLVTQKGVTEDKIYSVSGFVYDEQSGTAIREASIYEKTILASALTNTEGFFKIRLKSSKASVAELTVSKEFYEDTTVYIQTRLDQQLSITLMPALGGGENVVIRPEDYLSPDTTLHVSKPDTLAKTPLPETRDSIKVQRTGIGKFLLSARQKVQSINLKKFFTTRPFQFSLVPGVGSHGYMSAQVVNNFSLNLLGGYTAGTNGLEIGGLFNIDKKEMKYVQVAGLFNAVGGQVKGVQVAGVNNLVLDSVKALQVAGVNNMVKGKMSGLQIAGVYNHVSDSVKGMQVAGVGNFTNRKTSGLQIAGVANIAGRQMNGVQVAGVLNYSKRLRGVQIGLINIADTSEGYSIGLINIVLKGYHKLAFSANEYQNLQLSFKTGNAKLYSILQAGMNMSDSNKLYSFGYGLGTELPLNRKKTFTLNPELSSQYLYLGSWDYMNLLNRIQLNVTLRLGKHVSLFGGPAFSLYVSDQHDSFSGYRAPLPPAGYHQFSFSQRTSGWFGWNAGISFF